MLTVVDELAVSLRVGEVQLTGPRVLAPLVVGPRARRRELSAGPVRQELRHRRRRLARQKVLHAVFRTSSDKSNLVSYLGATVGSPASVTSAILHTM